MRIVTCYECRKKYNFDEDGFCPRCGAFNQVRKGSYTTAANGDIIRVDGINERAHENSFVHKEYHEEERERRRMGLDREAPKKAVIRMQRTDGKKKAAPAAVIFGIIWFVMVWMIVLTALFDAM